MDFPVWLAQSSKAKQPNYLAEGQIMAALHLFCFSQVALVGRYSSKNGSNRKRGSLHAPVQGCYSPGSSLELGVPEYRTVSAEQGE
eukprot:284904-Pelagomonas_calceolata.AAC.3